MALAVPPLVPVVEEGPLVEVDEVPENAARAAELR